EPVGPIRGVAEAEALDGLGPDPATFEVRGDLAPALGPAERLPEVKVRCVVRGEEPLLEVTLGGVAPGGQLHAGPLGQNPERLEGLEAVLLLQPGEDIAIARAPEAVVTAAVGIDLERRRLLGVEGAESLVDATRL